MKSVLAASGLGLGLWLSAVIGIALKLALPGRFDRLAIVLCLLLGWSGVIAYDSLASALPSASKARRRLFRPVDQFAELCEEAARCLCREGCAHAGRTRERRACWCSIPQAFHLDRRG